MSSWLPSSEVFEQIVEQPHHYQVVYRGLRRAFVRRFPYRVFFLETDSEIEVYAVVHNARDPTVWQRRR